MLTVGAQESTRSDRSRPNEPSTWERRALALTVGDDAVARYGDLADRGELERFAQEAITEIWDEPLKITAFIPILALRLVRKKLDERSYEMPERIQSGSR